eukprot:tig00000204_g17742.t1
MAERITEQLIKQATGAFDVEVVFSLQLIRRGIRWIEGVEMCINLQELNLSGNAIEKIENLGTCAKLKRLILTSNKISRIEGLEGCVTLEHLALQDNQIHNIDDVSSLAACKNLKSLFLKNLDGSQRNPVCDHPSYRTTVLQRLPGLATLDGERTRFAAKDLYATPGLDDPASYKLEIPRTDPWFKGASFADAVEREDFLPELEKPFRKAMSDSKALSNDARAMIEGARLRMGLPP